MGSRRCKDSAEGQGVSCHEYAEIADQGGDDGRQGMEAGDGDRGRRQGMEAGNGDMERVESQEVSGRSLPLKCSNVRSVSR